MEVEMKIETTVTLTMPLEEALWLQAMLQNPPKGCSEEVEKRCKYFFLTLSNATRGVEDKYSTGKSSIAGGLYDTRWETR